MVQIPFLLRQDNFNVTLDTTLAQFSCGIVCKVQARGANTVRIQVWGRVTAQVTVVRGKKRKDSKHCGSPVAFRWIELSTGFLNGQ
jgi:hypothetical protein